MTRSKTSRCSCCACFFSKFNNCSLCIKTLTNTVDAFWVFYCSQNSCCQNKFVPSFFEGQESRHLRKKANCYLKFQSWSLVDVCGCIVLFCWDRKTKEGEMYEMFKLYFLLIWLFSKHGQKEKSSIIIIRSPFWKKLSFLSFRDFWCKKQNTSSTMRLPGSWVGPSGPQRTKKKLEKYLGKQLKLIYYGMLFQLIFHKRKFSCQGQLHFWSTDGLLPKPFVWYHFQLVENMLVPPWCSRFDCKLQK